MTWTYDPTLLSDPSQGPLMQTRLLLGDTLPTDPQMQDEELRYYLSSYSPGGAAAAACRALAAKFSRSVDYEAGGTKVKYSQLAKQYAAKAVELEGIAAFSGGGLPYAGGISQADKVQQQLDDDRVGDWFSRGEFSEPDASNDLSPTRADQ